MESLYAFLISINHWFWLGLALVLVILEMLLGTSFFLLWLGISAAVVGAILIAYPTLAWEWQWIVFAIETIGCVLFWNLYLKRHTAKSDNPNLNRRSEQYIGRTVTLNEPIVNGRGRVQIDDSYWRVEGPDLSAGIVIKIVAVDGVVLRVEKAS